MGDPAKVLGILRESDFEGSGTWLQELHGTRRNRLHSWRAQTKPCVHQDQGGRSSDPHRRLSQTYLWVFEALLQRCGSAVACHWDRGTGSSSLGVAKILVLYGPRPNKCRQSYGGERKSNSYYFARQRVNTVGSCLKNHVPLPWWVGKGYIVRQEYMIRIKQLTVLYSFFHSFQRWDCWQD